MGIVHTDPILVNSTSSENVTDVLSQIWIQAIASSDNRLSVAVTCDSVPYTHASEIQNKYLECSVCHELTNQIVAKRKSKGAAVSYSSSLQSSKGVFFCLFVTICGWKFKKL